MATQRGEQRLGESAVPDTGHVNSSRSESVCARGCALCIPSGVVVGDLGAMRTSGPSKLLPEVDLVNQAETLASAGSSLRCMEPMSCSAAAHIP